MNELYQLIRAVLVVLAIALYLLAMICGRMHQWENAGNNLLLCGLAVAVVFLLKPDTPNK